MRKMNFLTVTALLFAGILGVKAQTCTEDRLNPAAGVPHEYKVSIGNSNGYNGGGTFQWYVTKNAANLMSGVMSDGSDFVATTADTNFSAYNSTGSDTKNKLGLTWKTDAIIDGRPYFLVLKYSETNGSCNLMNMKVMKIKPLNQFKLAIKPVKDENGTEFTSSETPEVCAADVIESAYDGGTDKVTYIYGQNTLYYKITASGFVGEWKPQIKLPALEGATGQKYVSAQWKSETATTWRDFAGLAQDGSEQSLTSTDLATIPPPAGNTTPTASYIVKVVIDNQRFETLANQTLTIATDGTYGGTSNDSLKDQKDDCSGDEADFADNGDYTIKARPTIQVESGAFVQEVH